ncbi:MAG: protein kinase [Planctomycetaceae bacterium]|nr:protein kinase [Planctomycetaceae bacterium]
MTIDAARAKSIFLAASERSDPDERAAYLVQQCGRSGPLRARVEALLRAHDSADILEQELSGEAYQLTKDAPVRLSSGTMVAGRYKLIEAIGEGGMGSVWLAEQKEPVKRKVAVKLIKPGMDSKSVLARFEAERQALALMDHPNIAKVFDGGMTAEGRPYFVMEFVKGVPLTEYCDNARLSLRDRLQLFIPVCQAVQHAHQKGIIHRDLKPSNILVCLYDGKPVPKVIDFGLAKAIHQSLTEQSLHTAVGMMVGTPLYMSPEQAEHNNLDVDTRTDIYSLGVILYELLTGSTPLERHQMKQAAFNEILRLIKEVEPPKPSTRLSSSQNLPNIAAQRSLDPNQLKRSVTGDLDWIVMKALDKERSRRYETSNGLARDIAHYLNDEAVEACPPSTTYRLKKFLRKHRMSLATLAGFIVILLAATGISLNLMSLAWTAQKKAADALFDLEVQREEALTQAAKAAEAEKETLENFRASTDETIERLIGTKPVLGPDEVKYLESTLERWKTYAERKGSSERSLSIQAEGHLAVGKILTRLGRHQDAITELRQALALNQRVINIHDAVLDYKHNMTRTHVALGQAEHAMGQRAAALSEFQAAHNLAESLAQQAPDSAEYQFALAVSKVNLGQHLSDYSNHESASKYLLDAIQVYNRLLERFPEEQKYGAGRAFAHGQAGRNLAAIGLQDRAEKEFEAGISIGLKLVQRDPNDIDAKRNLGSLYVDLGDLLCEDESPSDAIPSFESAVAVQRQLVEQYPGYHVFQQNLSRGRSNLALAYGRTGRFAEAAREFEACIVIDEKLVALAPDVPVYTLDLASDHGDYGALLSANGQMLVAEQHLRSGIKLLDSLAGKQPKFPDLMHLMASLHSSLGQHLLSGGDPMAAKAEAELARDLWRELVQASPELPRYRSSLLQAHNELGKILLALEEPSQAQEEFLAAVDVGRKLTEDYPGQIVHLENYIGSRVSAALGLARLGKPDQAQTEFLEIRDLIRPQLERFSNRAVLMGNYRAVQANLAMGLEAIGDIRQAITELMHLREFLTSLAEKSPNRPELEEWLATNDNMLAQLHGRTNRFAKANEFYSAARDRFQSLADREPGFIQYREGLILAHFGLSNVYFAVGQLPKHVNETELGITVCQQSITAAPDNWTIRTYLGGNLCNLGLSKMRSEDYSGAVASFTEAIESLQQVPEQNPQSATAAQFLLNSFMNRALACESLERYKEAARDWDQTLELCPESRKVEFVIFRALCWHKAGKTVESAVELEPYYKNPNLSAQQRYDVACVFAVASLTESDKKTIFADRAMKLLDQAVKLGFRDAQLMKMDADLDALREREDFQQLQLRLEKLPLKL